jgi:putative ABC transport system ATP-binding protein
MNKILPPCEVVRADGLGRYFAPATWALCHADLVVKAGESIALVGPSGSGKSTFLALLGLLDSPTKGTLGICGRDVTGLSDRVRTKVRRESIGFVFQAFHLVAHLTVLENVIFAMRIRHHGGPDSEERARQVVETVRLTHRANAFPATLSGGEQQRVAIARVLATRPALVLCDEPTGNLDSTTSRVVLNELLSLTQAGSAVVIVTHDVEIARQCARTVHVRDGRTMENA